MQPATDKLLNDIKEDYEKFLNLGNSSLRAAYLATSGRGFLEIKNSLKDSIFLLRPEDETYLILSTPEVTIEKLIPVREKVARFHTDKEIFN